MSASHPSQTLSPKQRRRQNAKNITQHFPGVRLRIADEESNKLPSPAKASSEDDEGEEENEKLEKTSPRSDE